MMMQLGADGVFVDRAISLGNPSARAAAIVKATAYYDDPAVIAEVSRDWARQWWAMLPTFLHHRLAERGW